MHARNRIGAALSSSAPCDTETTDVVVIGGGPAGCAAALTLLKYSALSVVLLESSTYSSFRIGESLGPGVRPLLSYLGAEGCLSSPPHLPAHGTAAAWGSRDVLSRDFLFTGRGQGWHLDRLRFDSDLATLVKQSGGGLLLHSTVEEESRGSDGHWDLVIRRSEQERTHLRARFVIDASGRSAVFSRRRGAKPRVYDNLVGVAGLCEPNGSLPQDTFTVVEAMTTGWWYSAPLPDQRVIAVLMSDADLVRSLRLHRLDQWNKMLSASTHTRLRLTGGRIRTPLQVFAASSQLLTPCIGKGWMATGEAAAAFDPLSSIGVGHALLSGIEAARSAAANLAGDSRLMQLYSESVARNFHESWNLRSGYYSIERRWPKRRFWSRRCGSHVEMNATYK